MASTLAALDRRAGDLAEPRERGRVDRRMRLADDDRLAADGRVAGGERAGAPDELRAALDDQVGIDAEHRQLERRSSAAKRSVVVVRRLAVVVEQARAGDELGVARFGQDERRAHRERQVALGADVEDLGARPRGDEVAARFARGDDVVIGGAIDAEAIELLETTSASAAAHW